MNFNSMYFLYDMSILTIPAPSDKFVLQTDVSARGIAGVLSVIRQEEELPVASSQSVTSGRDVVLCYKT